MLRSPIACDGRRIALALSGGHVLVADTAIASETAGNDSNPQVLIAPDTEVIAVALGADGYVVAACANKKVIVWDDKGVLQGENQTKKKPTAVGFICATDGSRRRDVVLTSDKFGDLWAMPMPDPSIACALLLGHTSRAITCMAVAEDGSWIATGDRGEHVRISEFPRTVLTKSYLMGHVEFLCSVSIVPGHKNLLLTAGGDKMIGLFDVNDGKKLARCSIEGLMEDAGDVNETVDGGSGNVDGCGNGEGFVDGSDGAGGAVDDESPMPIWEPSDETAEQEEEERGSDMLPFLKSMPLKIVGLSNEHVAVAVKGYAGVLLYRILQQHEAKFTLEFRERHELPGEVSGMCACGDSIYFVLPAPTFVSSYRVEDDKLVPVDENDVLSRVCTSVRNTALEQQLSILSVLALDGRPAGELARDDLKDKLSGGQAWNDRAKRQKRKKKGQR